MRCQLTGCEGKGVRAHIIPKSFYNLDYSQSVPLLVLTNSDDGYNGKSFAGIYDTTIVTDQGERVFSPWDDYACELLLTSTSKFRERTDQGQVLALELAEYHYVSLKLFFLSVLWRAHASSQLFFRDVGLGPFEEPLRQALLAADPGDINFFSVTLGCFIDMANRSAMLNPFRERIGGVNHYRVFMGRYIAYIKVDRQRTPALFREACLAPGRPLTILTRSFDQSEEKVVLRKLVEQADV